MRKFLSILFVLLLASPMIMAQKKTGDIYGKVMDEDGNPLPGVTLTLSSQYIAEMTAVSSAKGNYRFVGLPPAEDYTLTAKLQGFKTDRKSNIIVNVNAYTEINITMEMGEIEEEVTVTATTPVVDKKTTKVSHNVGHQALQSLPSARDPWVIAQMAPGVLVDHENVGGSRSGQQSEMLIKGGSGDYTTYNIDAVNATDPDAMGASPGYYDFGMFEEIDYTTGGADVTQMQPGINLNIVTRRGGNQVSLGGRLYWTYDGLQRSKDKYVKEVQKEDPQFDGLQKINDVKDYGFNMGAPIISDKLWAWGHFGIQRPEITLVTGAIDKTLLHNMGLKLNAQIVPENRFEIYTHMSKKNKWGRAASHSFPSGYYQTEPGGFQPMVKIQDEHMFGDNLFLSAKYVYSMTGFGLIPMADRDREKVAWYDETEEAWIGPFGEGGHDSSIYKRPVQQSILRTTYFNDDLFGASHEMLFGLEYAHKVAKTEGDQPGNFYIYWNIDWGSVADFDGDGDRDPAPSPYFMKWYIDRDLIEEGIIDHYAAYFRDTITFGNFNFLIGARYDIQQPILGKNTSAYTDFDNPAWDVATPAVRDAIKAQFPSVSLGKHWKTKDIEGNLFNFTDFLPRLGITWDVRGDGKTVAKLSFNMYSRFADVDWGENWYPVGMGGDFNLYWWDDGDMTAELDELFWYYFYSGPRYQLYRVFDDQGNFIGDWDDAEGYWWYDYDHEDPSYLSPYHYNNYATDLTNMKTVEIMLTLQQEVMPDMGVMVSASYRRYWNWYWEKNMFMKGGEPWLIESQDWYVSSGETIPNQIDTGDLPEDWATTWDGSTGDAGGREWYHLTNDYNGFDVSSYTPYDYRENMDGYYEQYTGLDFVVNKRLSNKWMMNASFTIQHQWRHWEDQAVLNRTNLWSEQDRVYNIWEYSPWMFKISGLYQLPYGFTVSGFFHARDGWRIEKYIDLQDNTPGANPRDDEITIRLGPYAEESTAIVHKLDLRIEKVVKYSDRGRIYLMADMFNVFNYTPALDRYSKYYGTLYFYGQNDSRNSFSPYSRPYTISEMMVPTVFRFGIRFEF